MSPTGRPDGERDGRFLNAGQLLRWSETASTLPAFFSRPATRAAKAVGLLLFGVQVGLEAAGEGFDPPGQTVKTTADLGLFRCLGVESRRSGLPAADVGLVHRRRPLFQPADAGIEVGDALFEPMGGRSNPACAGIARTRKCHWQEPETRGRRTRAKGPVCGRSGSLRGRRGWPGRAAEIRGLSFIAAAPT